MVHPGRVIGDAGVRHVIQLNARMRPVGRVKLVRDQQGMWARSSF